LKWLFVSDLHGRRRRYRSLFKRVNEGDIDVVLIGGDLLPRRDDNILQFIDEEFFSPVRESTSRGTRFLMIMGNDDPRSYEGIFIDAEKEGLIELIHERTVTAGKYFISGYPYVSPTPFLLKDWEKYDVSRYLDHGSVSPEEGYRSVQVDRNRIRYGTMMDDLGKLAQLSDPEWTVYLFHSPPYGTNLDRVALDGEMMDHAPLDAHVGSIAVRRFIETYQPPLTLHGHIHESARLTGSWKDEIGRTLMFTAAHDGEELAAIIFDPDHPEDAIRELI
jgi:Icc-related predicted phosphoesterase